MKTFIIFVLVIGGIAISLIDFNTYEMKSVDNFLRSQVDKHQTPSIQYAIFDTGKIIYTSHYGLKNIRLHEPVDSSTSYHLYSVTKTFTALSVLQLVGQQKVELTRPVSYYLPAFPYQKEITVGQLLNHTSGIPNPLPLRWIHLYEEHPGFDRDKFFAGVFEKHSSPAFEPGTDFKYSNLGYVILGQLVEQVSGKQLEDYIQENILDRSGIGKHELSFEIDPSIHATGYHKWWSVSNAVFGLLFDKQKFMAGKEGRWKPFRFFYNNGTAYGGMTGSATGLIKYAQTLLRADSLLLNDNLKQVLFTESTIRGKPTGMSVSWYTGTLKGHKYYSHAGGGGGYYVELRVYPGLGIGSVIMYNRSGMRDERILDKSDAFFITEK